MSEKDKGDVLQPHQRAVAERVLAEEEHARRHLVVTLSGAHAYGFASPDSDLDLKAIHLVPTSRLVGLAQPPPEGQRMEVVEGVEIDYSSNELQGALRGILKGNGNYIERVLGRLVLRTTAPHQELVQLVRGVLSRRVYHHYRGFASGQLAEWEKTGARSVKKLLYVLRTTLTGAHLLRTGEVVTDLGELAGPYGFGAARELIALKRSGERAELDPASGDGERWVARLVRAFATLDAALAASRLPEEPAGVAALEAWLVELRRAIF